MNGPIRSSLLNDDPDCADLVRKFVFGGLVELITKIHNYRRSGDWDAMRVALHQLKGTSANYGYPELMETARTIELRVKAGDIDGALQLMKGLDDVVERVKAGAAALK